MPEQEEHRRLKVLLSAYACEPNKGSEPGVGWKWTEGLASRVELHILTRESNRAAIEAELAARPDGDPLHSVRFLFHDLGKPWLAAKRRRFLPLSLYYILWQRAAVNRFSVLAEGMDVVHHLTFCGLLFPGHWRPRKAAFLLGPTGAPRVPPSYLHLFGSGSLVQRIRGKLIDRFDLIPVVGATFRRADMVVPANSDTATLLGTKGIVPAPVLLDTGADPALREPPPRESSSVVEFFFAGQLERRKGLELSLRALAAADSAGMPEWRFVIAGSGPDMPRLQRLVRTLGLSSSVVFLGKLSHAAVLERMARSDVFLFTSIRDTSGGVNLEAMACGLPVICLCHQGVGDITDESCAERIPTGPTDATILKLAEAISRLASDGVLRRKMGDSARFRASHSFAWEEKFDRMVGHYHQAVGRQKVALPRAPEER